VKTTVERVDDTTVKLSVSVEAARVDAAIDEAARELAAQVKIPGFRPGRVPRRVLESRLGRDAVLQEAVRDALPLFYTEALETTDLAVVSAPEFDVATFADGQDAEFTATVEVRPDFDVPDYAGLEVEFPEWEVTDEELGEQLDALRERFADVETVSRPARPGDLALITLRGEWNGKTIDEVTQEDTLYEVGDPGVGERAMDRELVGASAGAILRFHDTLAADFGPELSGREVNFTLILKEVKVKKLPELDDDFALTASEYDTIAELRDDVRRNLSRQKRAYARQMLRGKVVEAVADQVEVALPNALVHAEEHFRVDRIAQQARAYGLDVEQYAQALGTTAEELIESQRGEARATVKAQLIVDRIGRDLGIGIGQEDLGEEIARQAARLGRPPEELAQLMTSTQERLSALVTDAFRRKTIDALVAAVTVTGGPPAGDEDLATPDDGPAPAPEGAGPAAATPATRPAEPGSPTGDPAVEDATAVSLDTDPPAPATEPDATAGDAPATETESAPAAEQPGTAEPAEAEAIPAADADADGERGAAGP